MTSAVDLLCGLGWIVAYVIAIFLSFKKRTYFIPKLSICLNFFWEMLSVIQRIQNGATMSQGFFIQLSWLLLDLFIVGTWLYYDRKNLRRNIILLAVTFVCVWAFSHDGAAWTFAVFLINVIMSAEFIYRYQKDAAFGRSKFVAGTKLVGTLAATVVNGIIYWDLLILWLGGLSFLLDVYYLSLLMKDTSKRG